MSQYSTNLTDILRQVIQNTINPQEKTAKTSNSGYHERHTLHQQDRLSVAYASKSLRSTVDRPLLLPQDLKTHAVKLTNNKFAHIKTPRRIIFLGVKTDFICCCPIYRSLLFIHGLIFANFIIRPKCSNLHGISGQAPPRGWCPHRSNKFFIKPSFHNVTDSDKRKLQRTHLRQGMRHSRFLGRVVRTLPHAFPHSGPDCQ